jgi:hypothetical protein
MAFEDKDPILSKIYIHSKVTDHVNCFKYLGYYMTHENENDINETIKNYNRATEIVNQV